MTSEEVKEAMDAFAPVWYDGRQFERITAYIYRIIKNPHTGKYKHILQCELQEKVGNSVVIIAAEQVSKEREENKCT